MYFLVKLEGYLPGAYYFLEDGKKIIINKLNFLHKKKLELRVGQIKNIKNTYFVKCNDGILEIENYTII